MNKVEQAAVETILEYMANNKAPKLSIDVDIDGEIVNLKIVASPKVAEE